MARNTYVISDVHGCYDQFMELLGRIALAPTDELWLLGDLFDRGPGNRQMADWLVNDRPDNVRYLMGNHERMMLDDTIDPHDMDINYMGDWAYNGGGETAAQLEGLDVPTRMELFDLCRSADLCDIIPYTDRTGTAPIEREVALVHAGFYVSEKIARESKTIDNLVAAQGQLDMLWERDTWLLSGYEPPIEVIFGHTPTPLIAKMMRTRTQSQPNAYIPRIGNSFPSEAQCRRGDDYRIMRWGNHTAIDCGCAYGGRLACLRLEDRAVFYANSPERKAAEGR